MLALGFTFYVMVVWMFNHFFVTMYLMYVYASRIRTDHGFFEQMNPIFRFA